MHSRRGKTKLTRKKTHGKILEINILCRRGVWHRVGKFKCQICFLYLKLVSIQIVSTNHLQNKVGLDCEYSIRLKMQF